MLPAASSQPIKRMPPPHVDANEAVDRGYIGRLR